MRKSCVTAIKETGLQLNVLLSPSFSSRQNKFSLSVSLLNISLWVVPPLFLRPLKMRRYFFLSSLFFFLFSLRIFFIFFSLRIFFLLSLSLSLESRLGWWWCILLNGFSSFLTIIISCLWKETQPLTHYWFSCCPSYPLSLPPLSIYLSLSVYPSLSSLSISFYLFRILFHYFVPTFFLDPCFNSGFFHLKENEWKYQTFHERNKSRWASENEMKTSEKKVCLWERKLESGREIWGVRKTRERERGREGGRRRERGREREREILMEYGMRVNIKKCVKLEFRANEKRRIDLEKDVF